MRNNLHERMGNMSQEIYQQAMALLEAERHQEAYELLLTIPDYPQARSTLDELLAGGLIQPVRPDIPTAAFIVPKDRQALKRATSEISIRKKFGTRLLVVLVLIVLLGVVALIGLGVLGQ